MRRILIVLTLLIFACIVLELLGRAMHTPTVSATPAQRHSDPAYVSPAFFAENDRAHQASVLGETFTGQWFTLIDGWRVVQGLPAQYDCTVWLFGNSTMFGYQVADGDTIADKLQQLTPCRVENRSVVGASASKQANLLRDIETGTRDIVVYLDGSLEVIQAYQEWHGNGATVAFPGSACFSAKWGKDTGIYKVYCDWTGDAPLERAPVSTLLPAVEAYKTGLQETRAIVDERGMTFVHILQPNIMSSYLSADEWSDLRTQPVYVMLAYAVADATVDIRQAAFDVFPDTIEITPALDAARRSGEFVYMDCCHVNAAGASIIAQSIAAALPQR